MSVNGQIPEASGDIGEQEGERCCGVGEPEKTKTKLMMTNTEIAVRNGHKAILKKYDSDLQKHLHRRRPKIFGRNVFLSFFGKRFVLTFLQIRVIHI